MSNIKEEFGSSTGITCTLASLASSATVGRASAAVDNGTNKFIDALLTVAVKLATGSPANDKAVYVYGYASEDGSNYSGEASGSDAGYTQQAPTNLVLIGRIECPASGALTYKGVFRVAPAFGGILPRKWGIVIRNYTGLALDSTEGNHIKTYTGIYYTST